MSDLVPTVGAAPSLLAPLTDPAGGSAFSRLRAFTGQPAVRRTLPWFGAIAALSGIALTWVTFIPGPQRILYSQLDDSERASVVEALEKASIPYKIDNQTGALTVNEDDLYRARMLVASDGALATPQSGSAMLDNLPMGASRAMEDERLRAAREHDLMLTIMEIDGVEAVRVHLAEGEKSVFVRDNAPPSASVMIRLARGRQLSDTQVSAIVNLVAGSVQGLSVDAVRVVDQHGRLLTERKSADTDRLELQSRLEEKMRTQVVQLLTPMLGDGNFTTEVQVQLDMDQVTSARESYDKDGVVRSEMTQQSQTGGAGTAAGVPGVLANTPPPATVAKPGAPQGTAPAPAGQPSPVNGAASSTRTYELGREVAVSNSMPGKVRRVSVAVALSSKALKSSKAADIEQIKQLVSAAIGADVTRGDQVAVVARNFESPEVSGLSFYETSWFSSLLHNAVALIAVLLVLLLGVRPLIRALKRRDSGQDGMAPAGSLSAPAAVTDPLSGVIDAALLSRHVGLAQRLAEEKPETAVTALRQMLREPAPE